MGDWNGWLVGCAEWGPLGLSLEAAWHWGNLLDSCLGGNWMCARDRKWSFLGRNSEMDPS